MEVTSFSVDIVQPPKDDLLSKIKASTLTLQEHDVVAISSKVVSIWQGRCVPRDTSAKDALVKKEADWYLERTETPGAAVMHTIHNGILIPASGIDPLGRWYVLWPEKLKETAEQLLVWFKKEYGVENLYVVLTDSRSVFMRQGVVGMAIAWAGFEPLYDNRSRTDLLGLPSGGSQVNIPDALAAAAVLVMGEANEQTPIVRMRDVPYVATPQTHREERFNDFEISMEDDIYAPFLKNVKWQKGGNPQP